MQPAIRINGTECSKRLHHRLLARLCVIGPLQDYVARGKHCFHIALLICIARAEILLIVCSHLAQCLPVLLRMHKNRIILCRTKVKDSFKHLIFYFDHTQRTVHTALVPSCHNRYRVSCKPDMTVKHQAVLRARLRPRLSG